MNLTSNILTTLSGRIIVLGMSLVSALVLARTLGPEGRGLFALVLLLPELATAFGRLGIEQANAVYAGLEPDRRRALSWHSALIAGGVGGLIALSGFCYIFLGAPGLQGAMRGPAWLYIVPLALVPCRILAEYWLAILRGMNRIVLLNVIEVGTKVASLALILICVVILGAGVPGAVWVDSAVVIGTVLVLASLLAYVGVMGWPTFDRALLKRSAAFALPAHFAGVMTYLNYRIDQFIIAIMLPPDQLAIYVIAVEVAERIWILPGAVSAALLPHLTNSPVRDPTVAAVVTRHTILWTAALCIVVYALAPWAIELLFSSAFASSASPLRWLLPGIFALALAKVLVAELLSREKIHFTVWLSLIAASVNACLNFVLLPRMGIAGAALASSVSYFLVAVVVIWYYVRVTGVSWRMLSPRRSDLVVYVALARAMPEKRVSVHRSAGHPKPF
jgi:O-antigen/teichoic acid export membrane protein